MGQRQALALGKWFGALPPGRQPDTLLCSPYRRAWDTARLIIEGGGLDLPRDAVRADEHLREKKFGIVDRLTVHGIRQQYPALAEQRDHVGKFYFRPPGGESLCDVNLRLRSATDTLARHYGGARLLIVAHEEIVTCFRSLFEAMDEASVLALDGRGDVPNCGVTCYENPGGGAEILKARSRRVQGARSASVINWRLRNKDMKNRPAAFLPVSQATRAPALSLRRMPSARYGVTVSTRSARML